MERTPWPRQLDTADNRWKGLPLVEALKATYPYYVVRLGGGILFLVGMFIMLYNVVKTVTVVEPRVDFAAVPVPAA